MLTMTDKEFQKRTYRVTRELIYGQIATVAAFALICLGTYQIRGCFERKPEPQQVRPAVPESQLEKDVRSYHAPQK